MANLDTYIELTQVHALLWDTILAAECFTGYFKKTYRLDGTENMATELGPTGLQHMPSIGIAPLAMSPRRFSNLSMKMPLVLQVTVCTPQWSLTAPFQVASALVHVICGARALRPYLAKELPRIQFRPRELPGPAEAPKGPRFIQTELTVALETCAAFGA